MTEFNITSLLRRGREIEREEHAAGEVGKIGTLRAGSTGILADNGDIAGYCHRKAHLRSLGIEIDPPTDDKLIMFELGYASEDVVADSLLKSLPEGLVMLREEEIPIAWQTRNGTRVTGRPDIVVCRIPSNIAEAESSQLVADKIPVLGLELKSVHSVWVAREVLFNRTPKLGNLAQAAHYMWKLNIPYKLVYKGYSSLGQGMVSSDWMARMFPRPGDWGSEFMEYNEKTGKPKHVKQFEIVYDLEFDTHGRLKFRVEGTDKWISSLVTTGDIERYYEYVSTLPEKGLGPRPLTLDPLGEKLNYRDCQYCPLESICDSTEKMGYEKWLAAVRKEIQK